MKNLNKRKNKNFESEIIEILKIQNKQAIYFLGEKLMRYILNFLVVQGFDRIGRLFYVFKPIYEFPKSSIN